MKMPDPLRNERADADVCLVIFCMAGLAAAIVLVGAAHAFGQDQPADEPTQEIVDLNALPPLTPLTDFEHNLPERDADIRGVISWQRADVEADQRAVDATREQTLAIQAQTAALVQLVAQQKRTADNIASLTEAVTNINFSGTFVMPDEVAQSVVPALNAIKDWIDPPPDDPAPDAGN